MLIWRELTPERRVFGNCPDLWWVGGLDSGPMAWVFAAGGNTAGTASRRTPETSAGQIAEVVAVVIVSTPFPVPLGIRFQKDGEAEVPCALAFTNAR